TESRAVDLGPHPHIGLQTVSWLLEGGLQHDDSLGSEALLRPGGVNVMTAGSGIAHAERTPGENSGRIDGAQLWIALPSESRETDASFEHIQDVPMHPFAGGVAHVFAGSLDGTSSPAKHFSELVGADFEFGQGAAVELPLQAAFEHALVVMHG